MNCPICLKPLGVWDRALGRGAHSACSRAQTLREQSLVAEWGNLSEIAYFEWCCLYDGKTCKECVRMDGLKWLPGYPDAPHEPLASCTNREGCRCSTVAVFADSGTITQWREGREITVHQPGDAEDIAGFLKRSGGMATLAQVGAWVDARRAPELERRALEHSAAEKTNAAYQLEKGEPDRALGLYRESAGMWKAAIKGGPEPWAWDRLDFIYDRMSLLLERSKKFEEALVEIQTYLSFVGRPEGSKTANIRKREERLKKKLALRK